MNEAFTNGRIAAHEYPARILATRDNQTHFVRPFGINPYVIWEEEENQFTKEYEDWNIGYEMETTLTHFMSGGHGREV